MQPRAELFGSGWVDLGRIAIAVAWTILLMGCLEPSCPTLAKAILTRPVLNPDAKPDSLEALKFCFDTKSSNQNETECIGSTTKYCINSIDDPGGVDRNYAQCQSREQKLWDRMLNERYRTMMEKFSDSEANKSKLKAAQQGWIKLRGNFCGIIAEMQGSASYISNRYTDCDLRMTAHQVMNLRDLDDELRR